VSAIAGLVSLDEAPVDPLDLRRMRDALAYRGPDAQAVWSDGPAGLVHCMFHTTPESLHERLPRYCAPWGLAITADARLDNRPELIAALGLKDRPSRGISDSDLILAAYRQWGWACPPRLAGDFAFAVWDARLRRLFCARDRAGVKPFFYYRSPRVFAFATELPALLALPQVPRRLNELAVADYLALRLEEKDLTLYQDLFPLPAAHTLAVDPGRFTLEPYWQLDPTRELRLRSDGEYAEAFREVFTEAVRCRLRSAHPAGSMLSGGLDSSSIVCVARELLDGAPTGPLRTFSAVFPSVAPLDARIDETIYVRAVLAGGKVEHCDVPADGLSPFSPELLRDYEHIPAPNMYMDWAVARAARRQGVRVLLSGTDGDSTVGYGYEHLADLLRGGRWIAFAREVHVLARKIRWPRRRTLWFFGLQPLLPESIMDRLPRWDRRPGIPWDRRSLIHPDFARRARLAEHIRDSRPPAAGPIPKARVGHWESLTTGIWPDFLVRIDHLVASFPVEMRFPFFDYRLMEFCLALPGKQMLRDGQNRFVMRSAMGRLLPPEVQARDGKGSMITNFRRRLFECDREILEDLILRHPGPLACYVDLPALQDACRRFTSNPQLNTGDAFIVFWNAALALWMRNSGFSTSPHTPSGAVCRHASPLVEGGEQINNFRMVQPPKST
jgi:asparagine synthase (glutamine-hydrolysing)